MVKKNTAFISTRTTLVPACNLYFYFAIPFSLMIYGETYVSSGLASIIFSNMPVAVLIASVLFLNEKTNSMQIAGLTIAIVALAGILLEETKTSTETQWQGIIALVSAVIIHAIIYTQCKKRSCAVSVITFNALPCFLAGLLLSAAGWFFERPLVSAFSAHSILATLYLGAFAGVLGYCATLHFSKGQCLSGFTCIPYFSSDCGKPGKLCIWICNFNSINALYYTVSCRDISYSFLTASVCNQQTSGLLTTNK